MSESKHTPGDLLYLEDGQQVEFVSALGTDGFVVRPVYERDEGGVHLGKPRTEQTLFSAPPLAKWDKDIAAKRDELDALNVALSVARAKRAEEEHEEAERRNRRAKSPDATRLDDFLAGRITHVVIDNYSGPSVVTLEKALQKLDDSGRPERHLRLLHLYGDAERQVHWGLDRYTYGPGSNEERIYPCCSEREARAKAIDLITTRFNEWRTNRNNHHGLGYYRDRLIALGEALPDDVAAHLKEQSLSGLRSKLVKAEQDAAEARAAIAKATGGRDE